LLKEFRPDQRPEEVNKNAYRNDANDGGFHGLDPFQSKGVEHAEAEECRRGRDKDQVFHGVSLVSLPIRGFPGLDAPASGPCLLSPQATISGAAATLAATLTPECSGTDQMKG
jgi:hypothetical protein